MQRVIGSVDDIRNAVNDIRTAAGQAHADSSSIFVSIGVDVQEGTGFVRVRSLPYSRCPCIPSYARSHSHVVLYIWHSHAGPVFTAVMMQWHRDWGYA